MLSNAYFLAKFRFDTAENEPAKNLQNFRKCIFRKSIGKTPADEPLTAGLGAAGSRAARGPVREVRFVVGLLQQGDRQTSEGSFSAVMVSKPNRNQILVGKLLTRSIRFTFLCTSPISKFQQIFVPNLVG